MCFPEIICKSISPLLKKKERKIIKRAFLLLEYKEGTEMLIKLFIVTQVRDPGRKAGVEEHRAQHRPGPGMPSLCALPTCALECSPTLTQHGTQKCP